MMIDLFKQMKTNKYDYISTICKHKTQAKANVPLSENSKDVSKYNSVDKNTYNVNFYNKAFVLYYFVK